MQNKSRRAGSLTPVFIWLLAVFVLSVYPFKTDTAAVPAADKLLHFIIYGVTCALFWSVLSKDYKVKRAMPAAVLLSSGYGLLMEIAQGFVQARSFSLWDAASNVAGALLVAVFITFKRRKQ